MYLGILRLSVTGRPCSALSVGAEATARLYVNKRKAAPRREVDLPYIDSLAILLSFFLSFFLSFTTLDSQHLTNLVSQLHVFLYEGICLAVSIAYMCAPDSSSMVCLTIGCERLYLNMPQETRGTPRFSAQSTGGTTPVGSDHGMNPSPAEGGRKLPATALMQTGPDNKQWIDLEFVSAKMLQELRRQYDPSLKDESRHPLAKGAAKFKAWARQSKLGIDIRLRRKINAEHDEVTDIHLVPDSNTSALVSDPYVHSEKPPWVAELPARNEVNEMPDNAVLPELTAIPQYELSGSSIGTREQLPRYEPREDTTVPAPQQSGHEISRQRPASRSSMMATPQEGLSVHHPDEIEGLPVHQPDETARLSDHQPDETVRLSDHQSDETAGPPVHQPDETRPEETVDSREHQTAPTRDSEEQQRVQGLQLDLAEANRRLEEEQHSRERFEALLLDVRDELSKQRKGEESSVLNKSILRGLKVADSARYETETDMEPPSPSDRKAKSAVRGKRALVTPRNKKNAGKLKVPSMPSSSHAATHEDPGVVSNALLERQSTAPKRTPASAGSEEVWAALLNAQAKIVGPEHPLTYQARTDLARSRASKHQLSGDGALSALRDSRDLAAQILGEVHPLVAVFSEDLKTLSSLTGSALEKEQSSPTASGSSPLSSVPTVDIRMATDTTPPGPDLQLQRPSPDASTTGPSQLPDDSAKLELPPLDTNQFPFETYEGRSLDSSEAQWNLWHPPYKPRHRLIMFGGMVLAAVAKGSINFFQWLQRTYGPEQAVARDKVRVRWTCSCGKQLCDDFIEKRQGAARELEAYLNSPRTCTGGTPISPSSTPGSRNIGGSSFVGSQPSTQSPGPSSGMPGRASDPKSPLTSPTYPPFWTPLQLLPESPWLLTCTSEDRFTTKLAHLDMSTQRIRSDKDLALSIRDHYFNANKRWWRRLRLRGLSNIEFVQFELHKNRFADVRKCPDMPPVETSDYNFAPSDLIPPVGSQALLHLFKHPEDYENEDIAYQRVPKRNGRLQLGVGWGINLVEGFEASKVWLLIISFFVLGSFVFGITWALIKRDVQGAFGVAGYICTLAGLLVGWLQATLG